MKAGDRVGPYIVLEPLGAGGMGEVYRARDTRLEREVALKRLSESERAGDDARRHALREARAAGALTHPNIAAIYDVLDTPDGLVIVMELVAGEPLTARLRSGPLSVDEALRIARAVTEALEEAHGKGIVHRDLKPANVMVGTGGRAKILDFGIARWSPNRSEAKADKATDVGLIVGSPGYMAPEQLAGGPADPRTDIYGVGLLLFEMLSGRRPFDVSDHVAHALAVVEGRLPRLADVAPQVPADVVAIVTRALAPNPEDRFQDARSLGVALEQAIHDRSTAATVVMTGVRPTKISWRRPALTALVVLGVLAVVALAGGGRSWWRRSPPSAASSVVAVVPFVNSSGNAADLPLAVGLSDVIAKRLGSIRSVRVLGPEATRTAADGADAVRIARVLDAGYTVSGSLARADDAVTVDVSLASRDGVRETVGRFTGRADDLFELHAQVVAGVIAALTRRGALASAAQGQPAVSPSNQAAFADYAQARTFLERPDVPGNLERAVTLFQGAIAKDGRYASAYAGLGEAYWALYHETKDPSWTLKAQAANLDALRIDPEQPEVRMALAVMYEALGRGKEATEELQQVLALQPGNDSAHLLLAKIHADRSEWDAAVAEAQQAIALRPNYWGNYAELAETLSRAGRLDESIAAYRRLVELQPDSARAYQRLGTALQKAGRAEEALRAYERVAEIRKSWAAYSNLGTMYYWEGRIPQAIAAYEQAITLSPNEPDPYGNLGDALQKSGQREQAVTNYRKAAALVRSRLSINPEDAADLASLALFEAKLRAHADAARHMAKAVRLAPNDGDVLYTSAIVHTLAGDLPGGCTALQEALQHGASAVLVQHADELVPLKGCAAYDGVVQPAK